MYNVAVVVGSLRKGSINRAFAEALAKLGRPDLNLKIVEIGDLPIYSQDHEADLPAPARRLKAEIEAADAVLLVTPEHNRSFSTALKNAIDWASRPLGENSFAGKPTLVSGASPGNISTAVAQQHLRVMLGYLDAPALGQPEVFISFQPEDLITDDGDVTVDDTREFLREVMSEFAVFVERVTTSAEAARGEGVGAA